MNRILVSLCSATMLVAAVSAQCFESSFGVLIPRGVNPPGVGDDFLFDVQPLNFAFPMGGVAATYDSIHVGTNGVCFLTNALAASGATTTGYSTSAATMLTNLRGTATQPPRIAPYWRDLNILAANSGGVFINNTIPGKCVVTWQNAVHFGSTAPIFTLQAQLFATGEVVFFYNGSVQNTAITPMCGISQGALVADPGISDLSVATSGVSTSKIVYQSFATANTFDLQTTAVSFQPNAGGGYDVAPSACIPANHSSYGSGCYNIARNSFYELFADAALAGAALTGQSVVFTPAANGYTGTWGGGALIPVGGGAVNVFTTASDDAEVIVTPSIALPTPNGPQASVRVHSNGLVSWGGVAQTFPGTQNYQPTANGFLNGVNAGIYAWHDYNEAETGSGRIVREEVVVGADTVLVVTWNNVENYSNPLVVNPSTMQMQLNLTTGVVTIVFPSIDTNTTSTFGTAHLVGVTAAGASQNPGSVTLATALPITTAADIVAMSLAAAPAPVSTPSTGTLVTYTQNDIPEAAPTSGVYIGVTIISVGQDLPGTSLAFLGMPGCNLHLTSFDLTLAFVGATPSLTTQFAIPSGVAPGTELFAQSAALIVPNSLPNGQNAFGATVSNAVRSYINLF